MFVFSRRLGSMRRIWNAADSHESVGLPPSWTLGNLTWRGSAVR
jgi:hypothetical protein